jgi:hypothetical protein
VSGDTKAAPSLADDFALLLLATTKKDTRMIAWCVNNATRILAALRAVEAVRAFAASHPYSPYITESAGEDAFYTGYRDGVKAVQTLLEGEK